MMFYTEKALAILDDFPDSSAKDALRKLVTYTTERTK
jgi:geranylgeranyl pyrophosphate synthase